MAPTKYEALKQAAAKKRHEMLKKNKENIMGLVSVVAINKAIDDKTRQQNRGKHQSIINWVTTVNAARTHDLQWKKPTDWRLVTERSINRYIPADNNTQATIFTYVTQQLSRYDRPKSIVANPRYLMRHHLQGHSQNS